MIFEQIPIGQMANFAYLIGDSGEAAIVDPAWDVEKLMEVAAKHDLKITKILITHTDYDHVNAVGALEEKTGAKVYVHKAGKDEIVQFGAQDMVEIDEGSKIMVGGVEVKVIHTPGHRPSNVCFLFDGKVITGDTLFVEGCGRVDLPGSDMEQQWESLQRLKQLPDSTEVYPGHDYGSVQHSTIKHEKENNHFMKCGTFEEFAGVR